MKLRKEHANVLEVFEIDEVEKRIGWAFESCMNHVNNGTELPTKISVEVRYYEGDRIAAYADRITSDEYVVVVNTPTYFIIHSLCHCIVLQEIYPIISYKDDISKQGWYADILTFMMLDILLYHEIGHIMNGHIDYIKDKELESKVENNLPYAFGYFGKKARTFISPEEWQSLEWNADDYSASRIIEKYTKDETIGNLKLSGIEHAMSLIVSAYSSLYTLMEMGVRCENPEEYKSFEHLPKRIRLEKSLDCLYDYFNHIATFGLNEEMTEQYGKILNRRIGAESKDYLNNVNLLFEKWTGIMMKTYFVDYDFIVLDQNNNMDELDEEHREYYKRVDNYYLMNLPLVLDKYAKCTIVDPVSMFKGALLNTLHQIHGEMDINEMEIEVMRDGQVTKIQ